MKQGIYGILNNVNGKLYIGSSADLERRWRQHANNLRSGNHCNFHLQGAWVKYGETAFVFFMIENVVCLLELFKREQYWIDALHVCDRNKGYNMRNKAQPITPQTRAKMKSNLLGNTNGKGSKGKVLSQETKDKISASNKGRIGPQTGRPLTQEHKDKIANANRGWISEATISASIAANKGRKDTDEMRARKSAAQKLRWATIGLRKNHHVKADDPSPKNEPQTIDKA